MVVKLEVEGYAAYKKLVEEHSGQIVYVLFSGSKSENGDSWCPDCVAADPVVMECLKIVSEEAVFIHCSVGDRSFWKDQNNVFRRDDSLRLSSVPTLLRLGKPARLEEGQCADKALVQMLLEDD